VQGEQPALEVRLDAERVAVGKVLAFEVQLQSLDGALDGGASAVPSAFAGEMLRVLPIA
jgi:hypothetical protein